MNALLLTNELRETIMVEALGMQPSGENEGQWEPLVYPRNLGYSSSNPGATHVPNQRRMT